MASVDLSGDERTLLRHLDRIDSEVKAARTDSKFDERADQLVRWRKGDQWSDASDVPIFLVNLLGNFIERKVALLTQSRPDLRASARNIDLQQPSEVLTKTARAILDEQEFDRSTERNAEFGATFGHSWFTTAWDPNADYGDGNILIKPVDPRLVFVDPHIKTVDDFHRSSYVRIDRHLPLDEVRQVWPGRGGLVKPDPESMSASSSKTPSSWWGGPLKRALRPFQTVDAAYPWARISQYWFRDYQKDPRTAKLMFPTGRVIHRAAGQDIILDDAPNPYWDGEWPLDLWEWRVDVDSIGGLGDVAEGQKQQEAFLRLANALVKNAILSTPITVIGDHDALTPEGWSKLDNRAVRVLQKTRGREFQFIAPPGLSDSHFKLLDVITKAMETVIGVPEAVQGNRQKGVVANSAVEGLMTAAETLVRSAARRLEYTIQRMGQKLISRIIQFYTSDRILWLLGDSGEWTDYAFKRAELIRDDITDEERRRFFTNFRFKVTPLSSLPMNRMQRALLAQELFKMGVVDDQEVLAQAEYPNYEEVLKRTRVKQMSGLMPQAAPAGRTKSNRSGSKLGFGG